MAARGQEDQLGDKRGGYGPRGTATGWRLCCELLLHLRNGAKAPVASRRGGAAVADSFLEDGFVAVAVPLVD